MISYFYFKNRGAKRLFKQKPKAFSDYIGVQFYGKLLQKIYTQIVSLKKNSKELHIIDNSWRFLSYVPFLTLEKKLIFLKGKNEELLSPTNKEIHFYHGKNFKYKSQTTPNTTIIVYFSSKVRFGLTLKTTSKQNTTNMVQVLNVSMVTI